MSTATKVCIQCNLPKPIAAFGKRLLRCSTCVSAARRERYQSQVGASEVNLPAGRCLIWGCKKSLEESYDDGSPKARRGMCRTHYEELLKSGELVRLRLKVLGKCAECDEPAVLHGKKRNGRTSVPLCRLHYERLRAQDPQRKQAHNAYERARRARVREAQREAAQEVALAA